MNKTKYRKIQISKPAVPQEGEQSQTAEPIQKWCQRFLADGGGYRMLMKEYEVIRAAPTPSLCDSFSQNTVLNRYANIHLIDQSRVTLQDGLHPEYIHANWVDGYNSKNAYILTQAPTAEAIKDYWRMIWQEKAQVIVCLTSLTEKGSIKADLFFPTNNEAPFRAGPLRVVLMETKESPHHRVSVLHVKLYCWFGKSGQERDVSMVFFGGWPDRAVPADTASFLDLLVAVENLQIAAAASCPNRPSSSWRPPIVVNCSAGVGRSATFVACQVEVDRLRGSGMVDPQGTVRRLRTQRSGAVQNYVQYTFICRVILEAARRYPYPKVAAKPASIRAKSVRG